MPVSHLRLQSSRIGLNLVMPNDDAFTDDYIANLLVNDAKDLTLKYSAQGLQAFPSKRIAAHAPKPNTRFLKNILLDTDTHNASLRAREVSESRSRLTNLQQSLKRDSQDTRDSETIYSSSKRRGALRQHIDDEVHKPKRPDRALFHPRGRREPAEREHATPTETDEEGQTRNSRRPFSEDHRRTRRKRVERSDGSASDEEHRPRKRHRHHSTRVSQRHHHEKPPTSPRQDRFRGKWEHGQSRRQDHSRSRSRSRSSCRKHSARRERRHEVPHSKGKAYIEHGKGTKPCRSPSSESISSDPLDTLIGPTTPVRPPSPKLQRKGRGVSRPMNAAIDTHFSSNYDPALDVHPNSASEDDWDQALEALRDRRKWKQQGADRLRQAGFSEADVSKWEKGGERSVGDVTWAAKGEGREWDRGKTVEEDGYGRLT